MTTHAEILYKIILKEVIPNPQHEEHYNEYINNLNHGMGSGVQARL